MDKLPLIAGGGLIACAAVCAALWGLQRITRNAAVIDVGWPGLLGLLPAGYACALPDVSSRMWAVVAVYAIWSLRLGGFVFLTRVLRGDEDGRYASLRSSMGDRFQWFLFWFFQLQGLVAWLFSLSQLVTLTASESWRVTDGLGVVACLLAVTGEATADAQLAAHRADPSAKGKTCRRGLWRYSRHPNYFFEWLFWVGAAALGWGSSLWWVPFVPAVVILIFLFRVTGIPATERQALQSRSDYREYQRTTSVFFPWFPQQNSESAPASRT